VREYVGQCSIYLSSLCYSLYSLCLRSMKTIEIAKPKVHIVKEYTRVCSINCICGNCIERRRVQLASRQSYNSVLSNRHN
jgi:hypothetical protein